MPRARLRSGGGRPALLPAPLPPQVPPPAPPAPAPAPSVDCPPLSPSKKSLLSASAASLQAALRPNRERGPYPGPADYRRTHIELLRADFTLALAEQLREIRSSGKATERVYKVHIGWPSADDDDPSSIGGNSHRVHLLDKTPIKWSEEKKLMFHSLVLVSRDDRFSKFDLALVTERPPRLRVEGLAGVGMSGHIRTRPLEGTYHKKYCLMMEAEPFFFPYFHVIERLRTMKTVPFERELVHCKNVENVTPPYLRSIFQQPSDLASHLLRFCESTASELSPSQVAAMKSVLTHRVALVQGPPGTGKTHLGVTITRFLLYLMENFKPKSVPARGSKVPPSQPPILVVTTTRHAVVEYLKRCLNFSQQVLHAHGPVFEEDEVEDEIDTDLQRKYNSCLTPHQRLQLMRQADVIAMTTTRAALTRSLTQALGVQVVIVEESGEALEGFVVASIPPTAEHLILLGDHKQLRPSTAHHLLASRYQLDVSILERLVNNGFECRVLSEQRRMRPEIARLVKPIYPDLSNHRCTEGRPDISGVGRNLFFLDHHHEEDKQNGSHSHANRFEARVVVALMHYLLGKGYPPQRLTILTTYKKQEHLIRSMMGQNCEVRLSSVDGFQGEENSIILLSLVRGNDKGKIGFMKMENRACVALSRAQDGLYIVGNMTTLLASGAPFWSSVSEDLRRQGAVGPALELHCRHARKFKAKSAKGIERASAGCALCALEVADASATARSLAAGAVYFDAVKRSKDDHHDVRELLRLASESRRAGEAATEASRTLRLARELVRDKVIDLNVDTIKTATAKIHRFSQLQRERATELNAGARDTVPVLVSQMRGLAL